MTTKKITSFTHHITEEGDRLTFTFSLIDENGIVKKSNERATCIVTPDKNDILAAISDINIFLYNKIPE